MVSGTLCPYVSLCGCEVVRGAAAQKGPMTYASLVSVVIKDVGLEVEIWTLRLEFWP